MFQEFYLEIPDCANLDSWVSNNFMVTDELFLKTLPTFETWQPVSNILHGELL